MRAEIRKWGLEMLDPTRGPITCLAALVVGLLAGAAGGGEILGQYGQCFLEDVDGLRVLHLKGSPSTMGYAHGRLLASQAKGVYDALALTLGRDATLAEQTAAAAAARAHIPNRFVEEVQAIAAGVNDALGREAVSPDRLLQFHSWDEILRGRMDRSACAHFAALAGSTKDGHVIVGVDYVDEPCVEQGLQNGAVVIVYEPDGGHTFCTVSWAGFAGVMVGINSQGLVVSEARFPAEGQGIDGTPLPFQLRRVMEESADVTSAEALLRSIRRTVAGNVLVADGLGESAVRVFEFTQDRFEVFSQGDLADDHTHYIPGFSVPLTVDLEGYRIDLMMPEVNGGITTVLSRALPNTIVRTSFFVHHAGGETSLQALQSAWVMDFVNTDDDFDFLDISALTNQFPLSLHMMYFVDTILSGRGPDLLLHSTWLPILNWLEPGWEYQLYNPDTAALSRYREMSALVEAGLGTIDPLGAIGILGGGGSTELVHVLRDPNSLHSVVFDATTMTLHVATAAPTGTPGKPDAKRQPYRTLSFADLATYPLTVETTPVSGKVIVDGVNWGQAPQTRHLRPGQHTISFGPVAGYETPADQIVTVQTDGATATGTYRLMYQLTVLIEGQGSVAPSTGVFEKGDTVTLTATPADGWQFLRWERDASGAEPTTQVTFDSSKTVRAVFGQGPSYRLTVSIEGEGSVDPLDGYFLANEVVTLHATPAAGWHFARWSGAVSGEEPSATLTITRDTTATARFEPNPPGKVALTVQIEGQGAVERDPDGKLYDVGSPVALSAVAAAGWAFAGWTGGIESADAAIQLTLNKDVTVRAVFQLSQGFVLTVTLQGEGTVDLTPSGGRYASGTQVTLQATPSENGDSLPWEFLGWQGDLESLDNPATVTIQGDMDVLAVFSQRLDPSSACCGAAAPFEVGMLVATMFLLKLRGRRFG